MNLPTKSAHFINGRIVVVLVWMALLGCDFGAEMRAKALREVAYSAAEEDVAEALNMAGTEMGRAFAEVETFHRANKAIALAAAEAKETADRRIRVQEGLKKLIEEQPESDPSAEKMCEKFKYPCSLAEVPQETRRRTLEVGKEIAGRMKRGDSVDEAVEWLLQLEDIEYIDPSQTTIWFQLKGGRPMPVKFKFYYEF